MNRKQFDNAIEQLDGSDFNFERVEGVLEYRGQPMGVSGDFLRASNLHAIQQAVDGQDVVFTPEQIMDRWCAASVRIVRVG